MAVIDRVKQRLEELEPGLPAGVEIVPVYDRSNLISAAIDTLRTTLVEEILIVALVIVVFLLHVRSTLIVAVTLPVAILLAFIPMSYQGLTANIMSLGGIAVAIGAMVDAAIVMIENVHRRLSETQTSLDEPGKPSRVDVIIDAMQQVGPSIFFSLLIITVSFSAGICARGFGREVVLASRVYQDLLDGVRRAALGHARAGACRLADSRAPARR